MSELISQYMASFIDSETKATEICQFCESNSSTKPELMITVILVAILVALLTYAVIKAYQINQHWEKAGVKHVKPLLFFGNTLSFFLGTKAPQDILEELYKKFPDELVFGYYDFMTPRLVIRDGDLIKKVLIKDFTHFMDHGFQVNTEKHPRQEQLFLMNGTRWRAMRVKVSPIFTSGKLKEMYSTMSSVGLNLLDYLKQREKEEIDARELMGLFSMDVISSAVFGMDPATLKNPDSEFRKIGKTVNQPSLTNLLRMWIFFTFPKLAKYFSLNFLSNKTLDYFCDIIQNILNIRREKGIRRNDFVQMMMELKEKGKLEVQTWDSSDDYLRIGHSEATIEQFDLTDDMLMAQAFAFMIAGFDATALLMAYTLFELTQHQDLQEKVSVEISEQVKLHGGLNYEALKDMKLLEASIKESQRKYPLVPVLFRVCTKDYELPNGYKVKKGDAVSIPVSAVHTDPNYYPDPNEFRPERFLEPIKNGIFLPFGEGPRICIAMRYAMMVMKYGLALFFMSYRVKLSEKTKVPLRINKRTLGAMPKDKILLKLQVIEAS